MPMSKAAKATLKIDLAERFKKANAAIVAEYRGLTVADSVFHLEAGIAAEYATAPSFAATNWTAVIRYYDALLVIKNSPVVALNRAVAIALSDRPDGLAALYDLERDAALKDYHLLYASIGELERRRGSSSAAQAYLNKALALARTDPERRFLANRLEKLRNSLA